ncbi:MAG: DUF4252 domain-containing protein [Acidobacteriota bacterium]
MKLRLSIFMLVLCAAIPCFGQNPRLQIDDLDRLFASASETVDVTVDGALLQVAMKFLNPNKPDEAKIREILGQLKGVYVKSFEFDHDGAYSVADVEAIRNQLAGPGWSKVATIRTKRDGENVDVRLMIEGGVIAGIAVIVAEPRQLTVVNVVGPIDPEKISQMGLLEGRFGIPRIDLDWGATRRSSKD